MIYEALRAFGADFWVALPQIAPRLIVAWVLALAFLTGVLLAIKFHIKPHLLRLDDRVRYWAAGLRYRSRGVSESEIHARTWFFRFWTNFASAPSLTILSLFLAIWGHTNANAPRLWYLPGLCYAGSMLLSFVSKRIVKRVRPERPDGAFGHKLKDGSFPSGHSLTSFCFWLPLVLAGAFAGIATPFLVAIAIGAVSIVILTGLSRIYLAVHFPSDVLGGFCMGIIWCAICSFALLPVLQNF